MRHWRFWLPIASLSAGFVIMELAARIWVAVRWPDDHVRALIAADTSQLRGRFAYHAELGYVLAPDYRSEDGRRTHNHMGFRAPALTLHKPPGTLRVVLLGASTVYGERVADAETAAARLQELLEHARPGQRFEVVNAGVPNWTSAETLHSLPIRVLPLMPDAIVVMDGRNDAFPQLFNRYRNDYSHYRIPGYDFRRFNRTARRWFRFSRLAMLLCTRGSGHCGYSPLLEVPAYASIDHHNLPSLEELKRNAEDTARWRDYRRNQRAVAEQAAAAGIAVVLSTIPFRPAAYASSVIPRHTAAIPFITAAVQRNQEITRQLAAELGTGFVDAATLSSAQYLVDDCHFSPQGELVLARLLYEVLLPMLDVRRSIAPLRDDIPSEVGTAGPHTLLAGAIVQHVLARRYVRTSAS